MSHKTEAGLPLEIERKFLIGYPDISWLEQYPGRRKIEMVQTYLTAGKGEARRVRQCTEGSEVTWYRTSKRKISALTRIELEEELNREEYLDLLKEADPAKTPIIKTRYVIPYDGHCVEIDIYPFWNDRAIAEIELAEENEPCCFPEQIHVISDVSGDDRYSNFSLAGSQGMFEC